MDKFTVFLFGMALCLVVACSPRVVGRASVSSADLVAERFNYVIGTQTIGPRYGFTEETRLAETARRIAEMGSNIIKFRLKASPDSNSPKSMNEWGPLQLVRECESIKAVLDMDFVYNLMWVTTPGVKWADGMSEEETPIQVNSATTRV